MYYLIKKGLSNINKKIIIWLNSIPTEYVYVAYTYICVCVCVSVCVCVRILMFVLALQTNITCILHYKHYLYITLQTLLV